VQALSSVTVFDAGTLDTVARELHPVVVRRWQFNPCKV
jgi:hypothetical protein